MKQYSIAIFEIKNLPAFSRMSIVEPYGIGIDTPKGFYYSVDTLQAIDGWIFVGLGYLL
jgi:hypothetical protein